ncbi:tyrosine-type recombinase/integrase [Streptomyces sp. 769]|uniref:tyrosine-type recombinase/integrase n=1 Tax=Streptomyces sp. 769 TaxID=1262452 RepID=UPI000581C2D6|nr:tyrosine-type recombinase/integrase [Streptomyces sp. 769]AJC59523.1 phage integrase [Streptomyces sp. 769]
MGRLAEQADAFLPYVLIDGDGEPVEAVSLFFRDLLAADRSPATLRSYGMDLLRWFRFLWAVDVPWQQASRIEARDFSLWLQRAARPRRGTIPSRGDAGRPGEVVNAMSGKPALGASFAPRTVAHSETVLRTFYDLQLQLGAGPLLNPFPCVGPARAGAHHNPIEPWRPERRGRYRPSVPVTMPRSIPDERFNELFAALGSHRDRALVAFWVSSGARAGELLGTRVGDVDAGQQLICVVRKKTGHVQQIPASTDAFVWLRLYQEEFRSRVPAARRQPLWWTLRAPFRPLTYHGAHRMFERANALVGGDWTLHDLRHTAAYRMARDPQVPLADVQWVLGHASLSTTQKYLNPRQEDVVEGVLAHYSRQQNRQTTPAVPAPGYCADSLDVLFGRRP